MKKVKCQENWRKCGLCGKSITNGEEMYVIQFKKYVNSWGTMRYRNECWHTKHFIFKDHSVKCKIKMECVTSGKKPVDLGCAKKLCIHYK